MKQFLISLILFTFFANIGFAQEKESEFKPNGKPIFKVFWNYHYDFTSDVMKTSTFELTRSYLGYQHSFTEKISAKVYVDVGKNDGGSAYTAFLKVAQLDWKVAPGV